MTWIAASILSAAVGGVVAIFDSHLISRRMPSLRAFLVGAGILNLGFGLIILGIFPLVKEVGSTAVMVAFVSGIIRSAGILLMLMTMRTAEISRIMPVVHTFPIFVAILAVPLLGETLSFIQWLAILITVAGAVFISVSRGPTGQGVRLHKSFSLLIGSSLFLGVANIASKYALDYIPFWNMYGINATTLGTIFLLISLRPGIVKELKDMEKRGRALALLTLDTCLVLVASTLFFWAIEHGPVSLASTVVGIRPCFVFIYAFFISRAFPAVLEERLSKGIIVTKIISIALIIGGVTVLSLSR